MFLSERLSTGVAGGAQYVALGLVLTAVLGYWTRRRAAALHRSH